MSNLKALSGEERFNTIKGDAFEALTRLYLLTHPPYSTLINKIWHHAEIPQEVIDHLHAYVNAHGTARVPQAHKTPKPEEFSLGTWVNSRRTDFKKKAPTLTDARINTLEALPG